MDTAMSTNPEINSQREGIVPPPVPTPCAICKGKCCTRWFGADGIILEEEEASLFPIKDLDYNFDYNNYGKLVYLFPNDKKSSCIHLKQGKCGIYDKRPRSCREFDCIEYYVNNADALFKPMRDDIREFMQSLLLSCVEKVG